MSRDLGSLSSHQLLQLQLFFLKFLKFWTVLLILILPKMVWIHELYFCFPSATSLDCFEVNCFHAFQKIAYVWNCFGLWILKFDLKLLSFDLWFHPLISKFYFSCSSLFWKWNKLFHHCPAEILLELNFFLVWLFRGHLNNALEPYFHMGPPLRKLNDDYSDG